MITAEQKRLYPAYWWLTRYRRHMGEHLKYGYLGNSVLEDHRRLYPKCDTAPKYNDKEEGK